MYILYILFLLIAQVLGLVRYAIVLPADTQVLADGQAQLVCAGDVQENIYWSKNGVRRNSTGHGTYKVCNKDTNVVYTCNGIQLLMLTGQPAHQQMDATAVWSDSNVTCVQYKPTETPQAETQISHTDWQGHVTNVTYLINNTRATVYPVVTYTIDSNKDISNCNNTETLQVSVEQTPNITVVNTQGNITCTSTDLVDRCDMRITVDNETKVHGTRTHVVTFNHTSGSEEEVVCTAVCRVDNSVVMITKQPEPDGTDDAESNSSTVGIVIGLTLVVLFLVLVVVLTVAWFNRGERWRNWRIPFSPLNDNLDDLNETHDLDTVEDYELETVPVTEVEEVHSVQLLAVV